MRDQQPDIANFFIAGVNYKKADASLRGQYAVGVEQYGNYLCNAINKGINETFIISTCNRTEVYGFADKASDLYELLCAQTQGSLDNFKRIAYIKQGVEAIEHLFNVAAGLDSQILGDYEILGQIKSAVKFSKEQHCIGTNTERLINCVLQSSKQIKTDTSLSGGTVSVSFAAIQYLKEHVVSIEEKKIVLIGTGKIGRNTCKNLVNYLNVKNVTLINRTDEKAAALANELALQYAPIDQLQEVVQAADIILLATNSIEPIITTSLLNNGGNKLIIDLSVPYNVAEGVSSLQNITLLNVDELSKIKDATLQMRQAEVPKAKAIIADHINEFIEWHTMRKHVPVLKAVKNTLQKIQHKHLYVAYSAKTSTEEKIQKVINGMAVKMKQHNRQGCCYIEAINEYIAVAANS